MASKAGNRMEDDKKLRFDENNIRLTNHPAEKDYGLMSIPESKTPYPRHVDPVEATELHKRLQEALERANVLLNANNDEQIGSEVMSMDSIPFEDDSAERERRRNEFLKKRKQFYRSEFLITRQKRLNTEMHPPGPSVGNNWRIDDVDENPSSPPLRSTPARITSIISRNRLPQAGSLVNQEILRDIAEQMSSITPWSTNH